MILVVSNSFDDADLPPESPSRTTRKLQLNYIEVEGPMDFTDEERRANPSCGVLPEGGLSPIDAARANLKEFLPRAFRRDVTDDEIERFVALVQRALDQGNSFEQAMNLTLQGRAGLAGIPVSRRRGAASRSTASRCSMTFSLASRLSYFLWSSMPDDELFQLARENRLHEPDVLQEQTLRLLSDPRSDALVTNFAGQWLGLQTIGIQDGYQSRRRPVSRNSTISSGKTYGRRPNCSSGQSCAPTAAFMI